MSNRDKIPQHTPAPFKDVTGIILAGGKSTRYGRNKALINIGGVRLIETVVRTMSSIFHHLTLITNSPEEYAFLDLPMSGDIIRGLGPLGGIYTGLDTLSDEAGFFVACDMPFLNDGLIRHMVEIRDDFDGVVPRIDWKLEALHALYSKRCLPVVKKLIDSRELQVIKFFHHVRLKYVEEAEIRSFDPMLRTFFNINRPEDLPPVVE